MKKYIVEYTVNLKGEYVSQYAETEEEAIEEAKSDWNDPDNYDHDYHTTHEEFKVVDTIEKGE